MSRTKTNSKSRPEQDYVRRLVRLASAYRNAEAAVASAFFSKRRSKREHLRWLKAQGFKEYAAIRPLIDALAALHSSIDRDLSRHEYAQLIEKLVDETKHARLVMNLIEEIERKKITPRDLTWLPQDRKLARVRAQYSQSLSRLLHGSGKITSAEIKRRDQALERAAITLTEGGGGALYQICNKLKRPGMERRIAKVFHEILRDEIEHKEGGVRALKDLVRDHDAFDRAAEMIREISAQRLRMRNEQFGFPLDHKQLTALEDRARRSI